MDVIPISHIDAMEILSKNSFGDYSHMMMLYSFYKQVFLASYKKIYSRRSMFKKLTKGNHGSKLLALLTIVYINSDKKHRKNFSNYIMHAMKSSSANVENETYLFHLFFDVDFGFHIEQHIENGEYGTALRNFKDDLAENYKTSNRRKESPMSDLNDTLKSMGIIIDYSQLKSIINDGLIPKVVDVVYNTYLKAIKYADKFDYNII